MTELASVVKDSLSSISIPHNTTLKLELNDGTKTKNTCD
jgi:hypothetical protein